MFEKSSKFPLIIIALIFSMFSCTTLNSGKLSLTREKSFYFLEGFNNDRLTMYVNKQKVLDTLIKTYGLTGEAFTIKFRGEKIRVVFNNDTVFKLNRVDSIYNYFVFNKVKDEYQLAKAKDTMIASW